jgi:hypothetical protein
MTSVGFDLHKRYITACALDAAGETIAEHAGAGSCSAVAPSSCASALDSRIASTAI